MNAALPAHLDAPPPTHDGGQPDTGRTDTPRDDLGLPFNEEAEQTLLGILLLDNRQHERVCDIVGAGDFHIPVHGRMFEAISDDIAGGRVATLVSMAQRFRNDDDLAHIGASSYIASLPESVVTTAHAPDVARTVHNLARRRHIITAAREAADRAMRDEETEPEALVDALEQRLSDLRQGGETPQTLTFAEATRQAIDAMAEAKARGGKLAGLSTGLRDLDEITLGLAPGQLIVLAARPSMGKSALAMNPIAMAAARQGRTVGVFSLEMTASDIATRLLAARTDLAGKDLRRGRLSDADFERLVAQGNEMASLPILIRDRGAATVPQVRMAARRIARQAERNGKPLGLIIIDYLQLMKNAEMRRGGNRTEDVTAISNALKQLAMELKVPVMALSQLSRAVETREDKRPMLSDLRESGSIEQDADVVMFLFREHYYLSRAEPQCRDNENNDRFMERLTRWEERLQQTKDKAEIIVAKARNGDNGSASVRWDARQMRFSDIPKQPGFEAYAGPGGTEEMPF